MLGECAGAGLLGCLSCTCTAFCVCLVSFCVFACVVWGLTCCWMFAWWERIESCGVRPRETDTRSQRHARALTLTHADVHSSIAVTCTRRRIHSHAHPGTLVQAHMSVLIHAHADTERNPAPKVQARKRLGVCLIVVSRGSARPNASDKPRAAATRSSCCRYGGECESEQESTKLSRPHRKEQPATTENQMASIQLYPGERKRCHKHPANLKKATNPLGRRGVTVPSASRAVAGLSAVPPCI